MPKKLKVAQVNEDFSFISKEDGKTYNLTFKEKLFAEHYLEFKGDGIAAIFEAGYEPKNNLIASSMSYENLRKPHVIAYVNSLLEKYGFNDNNVEKQHLYLLNQHADLKTKAKAIDMFYKLRGTYAPEKKDITTKGESVNPDVDLDAMADEVAKKLKAKKTQ